MERLKQSIKAVHLQLYAFEEPVVHLKQEVHLILH